MFLLPAWPWPKKNFQSFERKKFGFTHLIQDGFIGAAAAF